MASTTAQPTPPSAGAYTGRIVTVVTLIVGLIGAAAPVVLNMDVSSTAGIAAGLLALSAVVVKFLDGWQKYEQRLDAAPAGTVPTPQPAVVSPGPAPQITAPRPAVKATPAIDDLGVDPDEPPAPLPGETPWDLESAEELADVPEPPTADEIAAVRATPAAVADGNREPAPQH